MANKNWWFRRAGRGKRQTGHSLTRGSGNNPVVRGRLQPLFVEELEPRLAPAVTLTYGEITQTPPLTLTGITGYLADVLSTNFTLRAEQDGGNFFWRLYGTGLLPNNPIPISPLTLVEEAQITSAADLDVTVTRDNLGATDLVLGLDLIDFVGDNLTLDLGTLGVLDGQFGGTT